MKTDTPHRGKIRLQIGDLHFAGEGDQEWLSTQLSFFLQKAVQPPSSQNTTSQSSQFSTPLQGAGTDESLASFLRTTGSDTKQVQRFFAAAAWLARRGTSPLTSGLVAKTLQENQQKRVSNPSDCLNKNVSKGYCEKTSDGFFVTNDGRRALGIDP